MASLIFLGVLRGLQTKANDGDILGCVPWGRAEAHKHPFQAVIAKGNIIEGIEAKE